MQNDESANAIEKIEMKTGANNGHSNSISM